jgi:hypothetical protein
MTSLLLTSPNVTRCRISNRLWVYKTPYATFTNPSSYKSIGPIPYRKPYTAQERVQIKQANRGFVHAYERKI